MEYPMIVTTAGDLALLGSLRFGEYVTVHEVGHNWFQGILASNEPLEAWLDEGLNEWADGLVMEEWGGLGSWLGFGLDYYDFHALRGDFDDRAVPIATPSFAFPDEAEYGSSTYSATAVALETLENVVGEERFRAAMGVYARRFAFKHPTKEDFFATLGAELGPDARAYLELAFGDPDPIDFRVVELRSRKTREARGVFGEGPTRMTRDDAATPPSGGWSSTALVVNAGALEIPVEVELRFGDGSTRREVWSPAEGPGKGRWRRIDVHAREPVVAVTIDPDGKVAYETERLLNSYRSERETAASWRAGARGGFWVQTLQQLVGL
jgi:hypothetical protein